MNSLSNSLKRLTISISKVLKQNTRGYAAPLKLPITWNEPAKVKPYSKEFSGDLGIEGLKSKPDDIIYGYKDLPEVQQTNEFVKKLLSVEFNSSTRDVILRFEKAINLVKRHKYDIVSFETRIARLTVKIDRLQELLETFPSNKHYQRACARFISIRQQYLKKLRERDYPCFEFLIDRLNIKFHPGIRPEDYKPVSRKHSIKTLLDKHCDKIKQDKLEAYKKQLNDEKKIFYKDKAEKLEFIRKEEIECGVEPTVTEDEILECKNKAASFL